MSKTFDFRGGVRRIRISDVDSTADTLLRSGGPGAVEDFDAAGIRHEPEPEPADGGADPQAGAVQQAVHVPWWRGPWTVTVVGGGAAGVASGVILILIFGH